jgi:hypothetical protein
MTIETVTGPQIDKLNFINVTLDVRNGKFEIEDGLGEFVLLSPVEIVELGCELIAAGTRALRGTDIRDKS